MNGHEAFQQFCYPSETEIKTPDRRPLTEQQQKVYNLVTVGWNASQIAERIKCPVASVYDAIAKIRHWGYNI
jgi:DNA-binding NarL/FixJ family response regulator